MNREKKQIGIIWGCWDLFHVGHLNILKKASAGCDQLFIGVFGDDVVKSYKGKYPIINHDDRLKVIDALHLGVPFIVVKREQMNNRYTFPREFAVDVVFISERMSGKNLAMVNVKTYTKRICYLPYTEGISTNEIKERVIKDEFSG